MNTQQRLADRVKWQTGSQADGKLNDALPDQAPDPSRRCSAWKRMPVCIEDFSKIWNSG